MTANIRRMIARYEGDITDIRSKIVQLNAMHDDMERKTEAAGRRSGQRATDVVGAMNRIRSAYLGVAGLVGGLMSTAFVALADSAKSVDNQLKAIGAGSDVARKKIYALAIETRTPLEATVGLMRSISKSLPNQELDETIKQVGTLNRLLTIGGLDSGQRGSVVLQFGQALQSGVLSGDELRALRESAPMELMEAIARRAGGSVEQLRKMGEQGIITRDIMIGALTDLEQVAKDKFGGFQMTVGESMGVFRTALVGVVGEIDRASGASATMADAVAGVATFMADHTEAAGTLAAALADVAQYALLAAGARGLSGLGPLMSSTATAAIGMARGTVTATTALIGLRGALSGVMALLGGPWGVAIFAAGAAILTLSKLHMSFSESTAEAKTKMEDFEAAIKGAGSIQGEIARDSERLKTVNEEITRAIEDQAPAAEATALREKAALEGRITKNRELLEIQRALAREALRDAEDAANKARQSLAQRSRSWTERYSVNSAAQMGGEPAATDDASQIQAKKDRILELIRAGQALSESDEQWLRDYESLEQTMSALKLRQAELVDSSGQAANAHIEAWRKTTDASKEAATTEVETINKLVAEYAKRDKKIIELQRDRAAAMRRLDTPGLSTEDRLSGLAAVKAADEEIEKLTSVKKRVEDAREKYDELAKSMAGATGAFDQDGKLGDLMDQLHQRLKDAEKAGKDLDNVEMNKLEAALTAAYVTAEKLGGEMLNIAEMSFEKIYGNFDRLNERMKNMGLPYADIVAGATPANTNMIDFIKKREGMIEVAKYDENAYRVGYGTDKIYRRDEDGVWQAVEVLKGMRITQEEANYALMKRLETDFLPPIVAAIGADKWAAMNENQKAAMASLSYNHGGGAWKNGALQGVAAAARSGTPQDVADAIASLAMNQTKSEQAEGNKGRNGLPMNYERRMEEAALFGNTDRIGAKGEEAAEAYREATAAAESLAEKQKAYLASIEDGNEKLRLETELIGKTELERQRVLRIHEEQTKAIEAGLDLDARRAGQELTLRDEIARRIENEINLEVMKGAAKDAQAAKDEARAKKAAEEQDRLNEKKGFQAQVESDINRTIVQSVMRTGDWKEAAGQLLSKLAEAWAMRLLFDDGPMGGSGGGGLFGGITKFLGSWLTGGTTQSANGNVMTEYGPLQLQKYARGGIARSPQLSIFGEGRQPEAYVPLPDGRSIPVTIREPQVPQFAGGMGMGGTLKVELDLNNEMLQARIVEGSAPVAAAVTSRGIQQFGDNELPSRVRQSNSDPKRMKF